MHADGNRFEGAQAVPAMVPRIRFAHVVQEHREQYQFRLGKRPQQTGKAVFTRPFSVVEILQILDRQERMLVDGVLVEKVLNDMAANLVKLGK
jgi:hypothetical protein